MHTPFPKISTITLLSLLLIACNTPKNEGVPGVDYPGEIGGMDPGVRQVMMEEESQYPEEEEGLIPSPSDQLLWH